MLKLSFKFLFKLTAASFFIIYFTSPESLAIEGDQEKDQIRAAISVHIQEVYHCKDEIPKADIKKLDGKMAIDMEVDDSGKLIKFEQNAKKSNLFLDSLFKCIKQKSSNWNLPNSPKGTTLKIVYPFVFKK